jgi:putative peptide zinc metalloprotease protein
VLKDPDLETELKQARVRKAKHELIKTQAIAVNPSEANAAQISIDAEDEKIRDLERQLAELTIKTPIAGRLVAPEIETFKGRYIPRGERVAIVMTLDRLLVKAALEQRDVELVERGKMPPTEIRLAGDVSHALPGTEPTVLKGAQSQLPSPVLTHAGGGEIAADPKDQNGTKPLTPQFELRVKLANPDGTFYPGQRAYVRMTVGTKPLLYQWTRRFLQLIDSSNTNEWL